LLFGVALGVLYFSLVIIFGLLDQLLGYIGTNLFNIAGKLLLDLQAWSAVF
jgi:hypothetical protein